jgi:hypothetical protein
MIGRGLAAQDVNGDGVLDLLVGYPGDDDMLSGFNSGAVMVSQLNPAGNVFKTFRYINPISRSYTQAQNFLYGWDVTVAAVNADTLDDWQVGVPGYSLDEQGRSQYLGAEILSLGGVTTAVLGTKDEIGGSLRVSHHLTMNNAMPFTVTISSDGALVNTITKTGFKYPEEFICDDLGQDPLVLVKYAGAPSPHNAARYIHCQASKPTCTGFDLMCFVVSGGAFEWRDEPINVIVWQT